jgi:malonate-semialdehyde dehydrogenase (acetylating) / methylmalonate-semialdehyde dehydrogenase
MTEIGHFIDNARVAGTSGRSKPVFNPATGAAEKTVALATRAEVDRAVAAAAAAWPGWAKTPSLRRARILDRFKTILWQRADQLERFPAGLNRVVFFPRGWKSDS